MILATNAKLKVFISAVEHSGDAHCANLITALQRKNYDIDFVGLGGPRMARAGCQLLEQTTAKAAMIYNAFGQIWRYYRLIKRVSAYIKNNKIDLVIVCDSPAFNFHIAAAARKAGVKTLFYVAPQLWAWAPWRIRKLHKYCDRLVCILPFEQQWFSQRGIKAEFVGNPLFDGLEFDPANSVKKYMGFNPENAVIALMPGSRKAEIDSLWPAMQQIAKRLKRSWPGVKFAVVAVDQESIRHLQDMQIEGFICEYSISSVTEAAQQADFTIVASGSATLQVAAAGCPMVVMYQSSRILWHLLGRWLVRSKYLSLVNILADKKLVPEFMPCFSSIEPIVKISEQLLVDKAKLAQISGELIDLAGPLTRKSACDNVAKIVLEMLAG